MAVITSSFFARASRAPIVAAFAVLLCLLAAGHPAHAAPLVQNVENSPIPEGLSMDEVKKAILRGAAQRGWRVSESAPGRLEAAIFVRSHMAKVDITFDTASYSIQYKDSDNLDYKDGRIHRNYNKWVQNLDQDIQRAFYY